MQHRCSCLQKRINGNLDVTYKCVLIKVYVGHKKAKTTNSHSSHATNFTLKEDLHTIRVLFTQKFSGLSIFVYAIACKYASIINI